MEGDGRRAWAGKAPGQTLWGPLPVCAGKAMLGDGAPSPANSVGSGKTHQRLLETWQGRPLTKGQKEGTARPVCL